MPIELELIGFLLPIKGLSLVNYANVSHVINLSNAEFVMSIV